MFIFIPEDGHIPLDHRRSEIPSNFQAVDGAFYIRTEAQGIHTSATSLAPHISMAKQKASPTPSFRGPLEVDFFFSFHNKSRVITQASP